MTQPSDSRREALVRWALMREYSTPGVGAHPVLRPWLERRGWLRKGRLSHAGRLAGAEMVNAYLATGTPLPEYPGEET